MSDTEIDGSAALTDKTSNKKDKKETDTASKYKWKVAGSLASLALDVFFFIKPALVPFNLLVSLFNNGKNPASDPFYANVTRACIIVDDVPVVGKLAKNSKKALTLEEKERKAEQARLRAAAEQYHDDKYQPPEDNAVRPSSGIPGKSRQTTLTPAAL